MQLRAKRSELPTNVDGIRTALAAEDPEALVAPYVMSGGTDGKHGLYEYTHTQVAYIQT